jgi:hypothetical protein
MIGRLLGQWGRAVIAAFELAPYVPPPRPRDPGGSWLRRLVRDAVEGFDGGPGDGGASGAGAAA